MTSSTRPGLLSFDAAAAALRGAHRDDVRAVSVWALERGRPAHGAQVAVALELLDRHRTDEGVRLRRPEVTGLLGPRFHTWCSLAGTLIPEQWAEDLWTVVAWCWDVGRLDRSSDPWSALTEPFRCFAGLDADGRHDPDGDDVTFPCQCHLDHDPDCPPGLHQLLVGIDLHDGLRPLIAYGTAPIRSLDPPVSVLGPLFAYARLLRADDAATWLPVEDIEWCGRTAPDRWAPALSLYRHRNDRTHMGAPLALDDEGRAWRTRLDRRRRAGFRWEPLEWPSAALWRAGIDAHMRMTVAADQDGGAASGRRLHAVPDRSDDGW